MVFSRSFIDVKEDLLVTLEMMMQRHMIQRGYLGMFILYGGVMNDGVLR